MPTQGHTAVPTFLQARKTCLEGAGPVSVTCGCPDCSLSANTFLGPSRPLKYMLCSVFVGVFC